MSTQRNIWLALLFTSVIAWGQSNVKEEVFLHVSGGDLLVGETLHFSAFVRSQQDGRLSQLSKFLYVELLNDEGESVLQTKVTLSNGRGAGKYFIPSLTKTGVYHLTAYTRWMRNWGEYFHTSLHIINPYEELGHSDGERQLTVQLFPLAGELVEGIENELIIHVKQGESPVQLPGRLVSDDDDKSLAFSTNDNGLAKVSFVPSGSAKQQIILEGSQGFEFFDLPAPCRDCVKLSWKGSAQDHVFELLHQGPLSRSDLQLQLFSPQEMVNTQSWPREGPLVIPSNTLPTGMLQALLIREADTLAQRILWNGKVNETKTSSGRIASVGSREWTERSYDVPGGSSVSVSVRRSDDSYLKPDQIVEHEISGHLRSQVDLRNPRASDLEWILPTSEWRHPQLVSGNVRLLPEFRSDLIEGFVTNLDLRPEADLSVALSVPSRPYQLRIRQSTEDGTFVFDYDSKITIDRGVLKVFENASQRNLRENNPQPINPLDRLPPNTSMVTMDVDERYRLHVLSEFYDAYPEDLPGNPLTFDTLKVQSYIQRSIYNQIENAYYEQPVDTLLIGVPQIYGMKSYVLDDYTRFPTMRDTFIEFIPSIGVSKNEKNFEINLRTVTDYEHRRVGGESILLIDGVLVTSEAILTISPYLVQRIDVLDKKYFFAEKMFDGILSVHTFGGDAWDTPSKSRQIGLAPVQAVPADESSPAPTDERHADYRTLLSWQPLKTVSEDGQLSVSFRTSDVPGRYLIEIQGVTPDGSPVSIQEEIEVSADRPEN